jgi:hypothetical protein
MTEKVRIEVSLLVETRLDMEVSWDDDVEQVEIHNVQRRMLQPDISADRIGENLSDVDWEYIEEETIKALGIKRD